MARPRTQDRDKLIILLSTIGSLVCLNILSVQHFWRIDLTRDDVFTLSSASTKTMSDLEDPVTVTAYFTANLPPPFSQNAQFVRDLLEEYRASSKGMLSYEFIDPESAETDEDKAIKKDVKVDIFGRRMRDKTSIESELERLGVSPVEIRVIEEDQAQTKRAYMGLVVRYGEETEVLPVVQSTGDLEYNLTTQIRNLTRTRVPVLGIAQGHGELSLSEDLANLKGLLEQVYEVKPVTLPADLKDGKIDDDIDAMLVLGPKQSYGEPALKAIDAFLASGKSAAFLIDHVDVDLKTFQAKPTEHGLGDLLASYGIELGSQLVADVSSASLSVQRRMGPMVVNMPLRYPFIPVLPRLEGDSALTRGLADVTMPFPTAVYLSDDVMKANEGKLSGTILAKSTEKSWLEDATPMNMAPQRFAERVEAIFTGPYNLMASVEGALPAHYPENARASDDTAPADGAGGADEESAEATSASGQKKSRVLVAGTAGIVRDDFLNPANAALTLNMVDWLLLDPALLGMRTRGLIDPPLREELPDSTRNFVKYGNAVGVPLLLVLYGLIRWQRRESRRRRLNQTSAA